MLIVGGHDQFSLAMIREQAFPTFLSPFLYHSKEKLYRTWVQHDSDASTEALGRKVVLELGSDDTAVAVRAGDLSPDDSDLAALSFF